jgi:hypothetical protein
VFVKSVIEIRATDSGYAGPWLGVGAPFIIAAATVIMGAVLLILSIPRYREFFKRKPEIVDPAILEEAPATGGAS